MTRFRTYISQSKSHSVYLFFVKILSAISTLVLLPTILRICGRDLWLQVATLQTIAIIVSPLIQMHWTKFGGIILSQNNEQNKKKLIIQSVTSRLMVLITINIAMVLVVIKYFDHNHLGILISSFVFASSTALSNEWYYLAKSNYGGFFLQESLPRFLFIFLPLFFIDNEMQLTVLFFTLASVNIITSSLILKWSARGHQEAFSGVHDRISKFRFVILQFVTFLILFSPVPIVKYFNFENKFEFTLMEKFLRFFMTAVLPISQMAHSQILIAKFKTPISREWYRKSKWMSLVILLVYVPCTVIYLIFTNSSEMLRLNGLMVSLFGILISATFINRITEEIFVLNLNNMMLINFMQSLNIILLVLTFVFAVILRSSDVLVSSLILVEITRFLYMRKHVASIVSFN